jgi:hypothetical protein
VPHFVEFIRFKLPNLCQQALKSVPKNAFQNNRAVFDKTCGNKTPSIVFVKGRFCGKTFIKDIILQFAFFICYCQRYQLWILK